MVLGSGGTAPAAVVGLSELGVAEVVVAARNRDAAARLVDLGSRLGMTASFCDLNRSDELDAAAGDVDVLVSISALFTRALRLTCKHKILFRAVHMR